MPGKATGGGRFIASAQNIKAMLEDGDVLRMIRRRMGLGDTLGALGIESGGTGATTKEGARESLGLNEWMEEQIMHTKGATVFAKGSEEAKDMKETRVVAKLSGAKCDGKASSVSDDAVVIGEDGFYEIEITGNAGVRVGKSNSANTIEVSARFGIEVDGTPYFSRSASDHVSNKEETRVDAFSGTEKMNIYLDAGSSVRFALTAKAEWWNNTNYAEIDILANVMKI